MGNGPVNTMAQQPSIRFHRRPSKRKLESESAFEFLVRDFRALSNELYERVVERGLDKALELSEY